MAGDIGEVEVEGTDQLDWGSFEESIVLFTDEACVFNCFVGNVVYVLSRQSVWV
jgi:hypothetical protein